MIITFSKLGDQLCVRTDLRVPRRTISRSTQHVTKRARWEKKEVLFRLYIMSYITSSMVEPHFLSNAINFHLFNFRHRSYISGLSLRPAWREWLELRHCLQVENESPAPPVTLVSITMTQPPAHPAQLGPILMGWNVLKTLLINCVFLSVFFFFSYVCLLSLWFPNCISLCSSTSM